MSIVFEEIDAALVASEAVLQHGRHAGDGPIPLGDLKGGIEAIVLAGGLEAREVRAECLSGVEELAVEANPVLELAECAEANVG